MARNRVSVDTSEVDRHAARVTQAGARLTPVARKVITVAANKIKKDMATDANQAAPVHMPGLGSAVSYSMTGNAFYSEAEVGFDRGGVGSLANIAAYGTSKNPPLFDHTRALHKEAPVAEKLISEIAEESAL